jgi:hypothetical protein
MFNHTIRVTELRKKKEFGEFSDVIVHCTWLLRSYHEDYPNIVKDFKGTTPFSVREFHLKTNFTEFENLNESDILSWVEDSASYIKDMKQKHETQILNQINETHEIVKNPWGEVEPAPPAKPYVEV